LNGKDNLPAHCDCRFLSLLGWSVVVFANSGVALRGAIIASLMIIVGADKLMADRLAKNLERVAHD
jgi:hypothetical protein